MRFPWLHRETRQTGGYTEAVIGYLQRQAGGVDGELGEVAALEIAAGLYGRVFASALVMGSTPGADAVTARVLSLIGRELIRRGEVVFEIVVEGGHVRLQSCASWTVTGEPSPERWLYEITAAGPSRTETRKAVSSSRVVHAMYAQRPQEPWRGQSPMRIAAATSTLMANIETRLGEELSAQSGYLIPVPEDASAESKDQLKSDIGSLRGKVALAPSTAGGWGAGPDTKPKDDWTPVRVGANPPATLEPLRESAAHHVLAACGVPIELVTSGQGTASREAYRRFLHSSVVPIAELVAEELRDKLDAPDLTLSFDRLFASDLQGRARAYQSMVGAGMDAAQAAKLAGLV